MICNIIYMKGLTFLSHRKSKPKIHVGHILITKIILYYVVYILCSNRISYYLFCYNFHPFN